MRAASLFLVLVLARLIVLAGQSLQFSWWSAPAYLWQDALVAVLLGLVELATLRRAWVSGSAYSVMVAYAAINVPLARVLSSPLTWQMSQAARGALADSIAHYLNWETFTCLALVLGAGAVLPGLLKKAAPRVQTAVMSVALVLLALGPVASTRVDTAGWERNALVTLVRSIFPRVTADGAEQDWRISPWATPGGESLSHLRGAAAGRNVVLILLESTGARYLRPYGAAEDPMPHLSRLAGQGLQFDNACSVYPESIKGLFSILCSRYPAFDTSPADYEQVTTPSLARSLADAGFRTALFHSGRFAYLGMESIIRHRGFELLEDAGAIGGQVHSSFGVDEPATVDRMLAWVDALPRAQRFFITYLPIAGHHPYDSPEPGPFAGNDERTHYLNALHFGDAALGRFIDGLEARGLGTNTLFVIFGDHGEAFGQHPGNYGHTLFIHEENIHVPYHIAAPGLWRGQLRVSRPASLIDTAPTILDLLGLPVPGEYQGTSLLHGGSRMALFYTDYSLGFLGLRDGPWKFIHEMESGRSRLFDLRDDPEERRNLAANCPDRVIAYQRHLEKWSSAQKGLLLKPRSMVARAGPGPSSLGEWARTPVAPTKY